MSLRGLQRQIALLRGINLGSRRRVAMGDLRELLTGLGYNDVRTLLQSGNVVLSSPESAAEAQAHIERALATRFGFDIAVVVRTAAQLRKVVEADPLGKAKADPKKHHVAFLSGPPEAAALAPARAGDFGDERFAVEGKHLYLWLEHGMQGSKLIKALGEKQLGVTATLRNWNTVTKLDEVASGT